MNKLFGANLKTSTLVYFVNQQRKADYETHCKTELHDEYG